MVTAVQPTSYYQHANGPVWGGSTNNEDDYKEQVQELNDVAVSLPVDTDANPVTNQEDPFSRME